MTPAEPPLSPSHRVVVRDARSGDLDVIVAFNQGLAEETEGKRLSPEVLSRGVSLALADPDRLRYWVAISPSDADIDTDGPVIGQAAVTREWSDWRAGWLWWFQSVYVRPDSRRLGVFRALHEHIRDAALREGDVVGLRLYVEDENARAQSTYRSLGMNPGGYHVYEELWLDRFGAERPGQVPLAPSPR